MDGETPLFHCCAEGKLEFVKLLLENSANINQARKDGSSPLYISCQEGYEEIVKLLINAGALIDQTEEYGYSPLFVACEKGHIQIVKELLKMQANIKLTSKYGETPLHFSCNKGHIEISQLLILHNADVTGKNPIPIDSIPNKKLKKLLLAKEKEEKEEQEKNRSIELRRTYSIAGWIDYLFSPKKPVPNRPDRKEPPKTPQVVISQKPPVIHPQVKSMKECTKLEVFKWISAFLLKRSERIPENLYSIINDNGITGEVLAEMSEEEMQRMFNFNFGITMLLRKERSRPITYGQEENTVKRITSFLYEVSINNPPIGEEFIHNKRFHDNSDTNCTYLTALAPLVTLRSNEELLSFKKAIQFAYGEEFDELSYQSSLAYGTNIYESLPIKERNYGLSLEECNSIYFYTLEWATSSLNLYSRLNRDLSCAERDRNAPKWKHYLHYLFSGLRKLPKEELKQDLYRGVDQNLVKRFPEKYKVGSRIIWYGFTSTTTNFSKVKSFIGNAEGTIFVMNGCFSGRSVNKFSGHGGESEVILPAGSRFEIVGVIYFGDITIIQLKQLGSLELLEME